MKMINERSAGARTRGALPCADCGQKVPYPDPGSLVTGERVRDCRVTPVPMARCEACRRRDRSAADLARRYLSGGVTLDGRRYTGKHAAELLVEARVASDAAWIEPHSVETAPDPAAVLLAEIAHLSGVTHRLRWRDRLNPSPSVVAEPFRLVEPSTPNVRPWAHLNDDDRARLRDGIVRVLAERVALLAPPVVLPPPALTSRAAVRGTPVAAGCLYCGVGTITMSALAVERYGGPSVAAERVWTRRQVNATAIGASQVAAGPLVGWLCLACERAAASVGSANSATALEEALSTFLGVSRRTYAGDELWVTGLQGWGALVADAVRRGRPQPAPNSARWGHIPKVGRDQLARDWRWGGSAG